MGATEAQVAESAATRGKKSGSLRDRIRVKKDDAKELVFVPMWDETIEVRSMTGRERASVLKKYVSPEGDFDFEALYPELVIATSFDPESGQRVFEDDDAEWLNDKSSGALELLGAAAFRLSGLDKRAKDRSGKGSLPTSNGGSTTT